MTRPLRLLSWWVLAAGFYATIPVVAQTTEPTNVATLREAAEAVGAASDAIEGLTDGIKHLVNTGAADYNYEAAKRERARLISLSARGRMMAQVSQRRVVESIDSYTRLKHPTPADWEKVRGDVIKALKGVSALLEDVKQERSDFVLEKAYNTLSYTLSARERLLEKLSSLDPPTTPEERQALQELNDNYKRLLKNFHKAIDQLNLYIKQKKPN
jgi:hypothetical protein